MKKPDKRRQPMINMRLDGMTYQQIGERYHISRQRVEQIISPPFDTIKELNRRAKGRCEDCGIHVGISGHAHHKGSEYDTYEDINQLAYLCISCHHRAHNGERAKHRTCEHCGIDYTSATSDSKRFCSQICRHAHHTSEVICEECGKVFQRQTSTIRGHHIWCSRQCQAKSWGKNYGWGSEYRKSKQGLD